ncbi:unnamed protein product, partial [Cylindrotheca closterium]
GLPFPMTHEKQKGLFKCWTDEIVGIALLAEVNLQWSAVPRGHKWFDRVKSFTNQGHFSSVSYHEHQEFPTPSAHQWGGCSATLLHKVARRAKSGGNDKTGLGRFSWIKIQGRDIRQQESQTDGPLAGPLDLVVSAYRPNKEGTNAGSVWNSQRNYWLSKGVTMDPRDKLTLDLVDLINQWKAEGCEILLGLDANEDVSYNSPSSFRQEMRIAGLTKAILRRHQGPYPATTHTRMTDTPIDGIFVTDGVYVTAGGYLDFQQYFKSDHRGLWIDIDLEATLGASPVNSPSFQPPEDISVQDRYLTANQRDRFNTIHCQAYEIRRRAERNCRKLSMGKVHWSPKMQLKWDRLHLYQLLILGHKQVRTGSRKVRCLLKKTGLSDAWKLSEADLQAKWHLEHQEYKEVKRKRAHQWRLEYLESKSAAV